MNAVLFLDCQLAVSRDCKQVYCRSLLPQISFQLYSLTKASEARMSGGIYPKENANRGTTLHSYFMLKCKENHIVKVFVVDLRGVTHNP